MKLLRDPKTGFPDIPIIALTATATERVREDIISQLNLHLPPEKGPYVASFNRKNLYYEVRPKKETFSEITDYLRRHRGEAGIIYCQSRNSVEALTKKLNIAGFRALPYHETAGLLRAITNLKEIESGIFKQNTKRFQEQFANQRVRDAKLWLEFISKVSK